jgi:hypothetical protein
LKISPPIKFLILYNFPPTEMCDVLMHRLWWSLRVKLWTLAQGFFSLTGYIFHDYQSLVPNFFDSTPIVFWLDSCLFVQLSWLHSLSNLHWISCTSFYPWIMEFLGW